MSKIPATIPLSKGYKPEKLIFPVFISEKLDGMPIKLSINHELGTVTDESRQGSSNVSVAHDAENFMRQMLPWINEKMESFVAEITHEHIKGFKDISGTVRRQQHCSQFVWNFFDYDNGQDLDFYQRTSRLKALLGAFPIGAKFKYVRQHMIHSMEQLDKFIIDKPIKDDQEGWVIRAAGDMWAPASRSWGYQKIVVTPSEDLPLVQVDEAVSKDGEPLGMAGKLWARYNDQLIGVGPGKLTHPERTDLWLQYQKGKMKGTWNNPTMEVTYKKDDTYTALREARFTCWRPDKD